jgi:hypothetical protein
MWKNILIIGVSYDGQFCCSCEAKEHIDNPLSLDECLDILLNDKQLSSGDIEHILIVRNRYDQGGGESYGITPWDVS